MKIACWSGPRNLSTAMMYAFGARSDCAVWDEPFYAAYLAATGIIHPMRNETLAARQTDPDKVAQACLNHDPSGKLHIYQKHMAHHMLPGFPLDWALGLTNVILIRHPARVVASYIAKRENPNSADLGAARLRQIHDYLRGSGQSPPILDSADIRADPGGMLEALCDRIGLGWDASMLTWNAGGRPEDGPWAAHWYGAVHSSTGFSGPERHLPTLSGEAERLAASMMRDYEALADLRLHPGA
ncbi:MAG: HAD family hydrolase [Paracoccaceae bacterium]|nr:HAD family hydrolase [Paracoccaceae bacterium]